MTEAVLDINAVGFTGYKDDPDKPDLPGDSIEYFLTGAQPWTKLFRSFIATMSGWAM